MSPIFLITKTESAIVSESLKYEHRIFSLHLEYLLLGTFRPEDSVKRKVDLSVVLDSPLCGRVLDADFFRVVREVGDESAACGLRRWGQATGVALR